jgi:replicative DNA helicase
MIEEPIQQEPYSMDAEEAVVACLVKSEDGSAFDTISQIVTADDFYVERPRILYQIIEELHRRSYPVDEITILERAKTKNLEEQIGGFLGIQYVLDRVETAVSSKYYANIVRDKAIARRLIKMSRRTIESIVGGSEALTEATAMESELADISDRVGVEDTFSEAGNALEEKFTAMTENRYEFTALSTGIGHLDDKLDEGGIGKGEVFVVSAPTSCGKSQLALNIVLRAAVQEGSPIGIFSFEMPAEQLMKRMVQTASAVNLRKIRDNVATDDEKSRVFDALKKVREAPIVVEHFVKGIDELRSKARSMKRKHKIEALVIDYLQLIPYDARMSKNDGIALVSHRIKQLAMELNIPIILLAQVNREGAKRESGLSMHDLKDSGDIENDADVILLMWARGGDLQNCRVFDGSVSYLELDYKIAKNREGERDLTGKFKFINQLGRFQ